MQYKNTTGDEEIDHSRNRNTSRFFDVCKFCFLLNKNFNYKDYACNGYHNLLMMVFALDNIATLRVGDIYYQCILTDISRIEALRRLINVNNLGKRGVV